MPILNVPLIDQWAIGQADLRINDCGVACTAMALEFYHKRGTLTVNQLAQETSLTNSDDGLMPAQLVNLATRHGLPTIVKIASLDDICNEINANRPVIALIKYSFILGRLDVNDLTGHYVLVIGHDPEHFVLDDPDWWQPFTERGHDFFVPVTQLDQAMAAYNYQAIFMEPQKMSIADQITALAAQNVANAQQIEALAAQIPADNPIPPTPPAGTVKYVYNATALNVRGAPTIADNIKGHLLAGDAVTVINSSSVDWAQITAGLMLNAANARIDATGLFVSKTYLSDSRP
jgi:uncharacterized protein YvpB